MCTSKLRPATFTRWRCHCGHQARMCCWPSTSTISVSQSVSQLTITSAAARIHTLALGHCLNVLSNVDATMRQRWHVIPLAAAAAETPTASPILALDWCTTRNLVCLGLHGQPTTCDTSMLLQASTAGGGPLYRSSKYTPYTCMSYECICWVLHAAHTCVTCKHPSTLASKPMTALHSADNHDHS